MAKATSATAKKATRRAKTWPDRADLGPWLERYLDVLERHPDPVRAGIKAFVPLKQLAECGEEAAALKRLQRFLDRLPANESEATGFLGLVGAEIALDLPDLRRAEKYLQLVEARRAIAPARVRKMIESRLRKLRTANGLTEPSDSDAFDEGDPLYRIGDLRQKYRTALLAGETSAAARFLLKASKLIPEIDEFLMTPGLILGVVAGLRSLGDEAAIARYVVWLDREGHTGDLATGSLWAMGLHDAANQRAEKLIAARLRKLKSDPDPNVHFPVDEIAKELWFLLQTDQREIARKLLQRVLRELPRWPGLAGGFATSGVLTQLAELVAEFDGPEAALELLGVAVLAGQAEKKFGFRKGALQAANRQIAAPGLAAAIAQAGTIKNAKKRREALIPLLTRRADWSALAVVLDEITDADELIDALHAVLFKLPGGARVI